MKCPICEAQIDYCESCPHCKKNIIIAKKIIMLSNGFYNQALKNARENKLSMAISDLKKSLDLLKTNTNSRNLLGLIYFRMGYVSDALKHWVISFSLDKNNNIAEKYILLAQQNPKILDLYSDAIKFYNLGLEYINQKNDDLGMIQLKKSLELNPDFVDALNLLALCYISQDNKPGAQKLLERALLIDKSNIKANKYYLDITNQDNINININNKPDTKIKSKNKFIGLFSFNKAIIFLAGLVLGVIIIYILVYPTQINSRNKKITSLEKELDTLQQNYDSINIKYKDEMPKLKQENDLLTKENIEFQQEILANQAEKLLDQAQVLYNKKNFADAAEILYNLNTAQIENLSSQALALKNKVYPSTTKFYYDRALKSYKNKSYSVSKENFEKALTFAKEILDEPLITKINYYLDNINQDLNPKPEDNNNNNNLAFNESEQENN